MNIHSMKKPLEILKKINMMEINSNAENMLKYIFITVIFHDHFKRWFIVLLYVWWLIINIPQPQNEVESQQNNRITSWDVTLKLFF